MSPAKGAGIRDGARAERARELTGGTGVHKRLNPEKGQRPTQGSKPESWARMRHGQAVTETARAWTPEAEGDKLGLRS